MKLYFLLFVIGAVVGTFLDGLQTYAGLAFYTHPVFFQTAWWVPFLFGSATVVIGLVHRKGECGPNARTRFFGSVAFLTLACLITAFFKIESLHKAGLLLALYFLSWGMFDRTSRGLLLAVGLAVIGPAVESFLGQLNLYHYTHPDLFGVPCWLPFLYLHISQAAGKPFILTIEAFLRK